MRAVVERSRLAHNDEYPPLKVHKIPVEWKSSVICPIYKKGCKNNASNYRPICLASVICKILERIVKANILQYLKTASILSDA